MKKLPYFLLIAAVPVVAALFLFADNAQQHKMLRDESVSVTQRHDFSEIAGVKGAAAQPANAPKRLRIGDMAPDLPFQSLDGKTHTMADWRGQLSLVMLADTTCPCVKAYDKRMTALAQKFPKLQVVYLFSSPVESRAQVQKFATAHKYAWPVVYDEGQKMFAALGGRCTTESFLFDRSGALRYHGRIDDNIYDEANVKVRDLEAAITSVQNGQNFVKSEVPAYGCVIPRVAQSASQTGKGRKL